jgi:hypothetical protein
MSHQKEGQPKTNKLKKGLKITGGSGHEFISTPNTAGRDIA